MSTTDIRAAFEAAKAKMIRTGDGWTDFDMFEAGHKAATEAAKAAGTAGEPDSQFVEAWKYRAIGSGEWRVTLNEEWAKALNQSEVIPLYSQKSMPMASSKAMSKVFKGADGLKKLADADAFWEQQPYGTRFYFGDGIADYLHREVLRAAVSDISAAPKLEIEQLRDQQAKRVMPMIGPLLDAFEGTQRGDLEDVHPFLAHWLNKINQAMVAEECPDCEGTGMRDSGGVQPWGESINVPCNCEAARQPAPVVAVKPWHLRVDAQEGIDSEDAMQAEINECRAIIAKNVPVMAEQVDTLLIQRKKIQALQAEIADLRAALAATNRSQP